MPSFLSLREVRMHFRLGRIVFSYIPGHISMSGVKINSRRIDSTNTFRITHPYQFYLILLHQLLIKPIQYLLLRFQPPPLSLQVLLLTLFEYNPMMLDKERISKLQKRLQQRKLAISEALQQEVAVDWLKTSNPAFLSMLTPENTIEIINLLIIPGPPNDKTRSFKIPMIAADLLSTMLPKVYELFFLQDPEDHSQPILNRLLRYFDTTPNYVISGYVIRILLNLIPANPSRVIESIFKARPERMLKFLESQSVAEFLLRIIIVEDALLNVQIKERVRLFEDIVRVYTDSKQDEEILANAGWVLGEAVVRLWTQKHKQMGRFSSALFRLVQALIDNNNLYQQESLIVSVCKQVAAYVKEAPFVIAALYKKIQQELALGKGEVQAVKSGQQKLSVRRFKYLQAMFFIISLGAQAIGKQLNGANVFYTLLDYITRYQWHSLALVEIEKILKAAINSTSETIFNALSRSYFPQKMQELARLEAVPNKFGYGFSGLLQNTTKTLKESLQSNSGYGAFLRRSGRQSQLLNWSKQYLTKNKRQLSVRVVHEVAKPFYSVSRLPERFRQFFDETQAINARLQTESPSKHQVEQKQVLEQIQNENELVYKLLSQVVSETIPDEKKPEESSE